MNFAFVALFVSLSTHAYVSEPKFRPALIVSAVIAVLCVSFDYSEIALLAAGFGGILAQLLFVKLFNH